MADPKPPAGEADALAVVQRVLAAHQGSSAPGELWIGDDAAVVALPPGPVLFATDATVEGVHADRSLMTPADLGYRALAVAVSDVAAMGGRPCQAVVSCCLGPGADVEGIAEGMGEAAAELRCPVVGGDLSAAGQTMLAVAVTGTLARCPTSRAAGSTGPANEDVLAVTRAGAAPGDALFVTGPLGESAAGLRLALGAAADRGRPIGTAPLDPAELDDPEWTVAEHRLVTAYRRPKVRLAEGWAARLAGASAMIDVSDGLGLDVDHLGNASRVGVVLTSLPCAEGASSGEALGGGEDFELLIAAPDGPRLIEAFAGAGLRPPLPIGRCVEDPSVRELNGQPMLAAGWQHHFG